jgi:hypothetical protein
MVMKMAGAALAALMIGGGMMARGAQTQSTDSLAEGFRRVPPEARMRMYWRVFGPAWTPPEIDAQFVELKEAGVGGVMTMLFYPVEPDDPANGVHNQRFLSPEFLETLAYAARKAKELGLRFSVQGGTGWPFGGPMVSKRDAAQRVRQEIVQPSADGGLRLPELREGERCIAAFHGANPTPALPYVRGGGKTLLPDDGGSRGEAALPLRLFIAGPTGMQVKRPALGAEGLVVDHYSRPAALRYVETAVAPLLAAAPGMIESIFCDSLEVYRANWTHDFPEQFRRRRGYDLMPRLPGLFDDKSPLAPALRFDFWRTLAELTEERFTRTLGEWARKRGVRLEMEAYGTPPNPLTAARWIDLPTGEQYEWKGFSFSRWAASGAHLSGRRIIGAEAWTWVGLPNRLADSLSDLKRASDFHFLAGCNDLTGVDFPYSPRSVPPPGWLPYFGPVMNRNNPQWPWFRDFAAYVNRCQWMLRQGTPVADVALYLPVEDVFAKGPVDQMLLDFHVRDHFVTGELTGEFGLKNAAKHHSDLIHTLITRGFNYDGIDFWAMNRLAQVKDGRLLAGDGNYSVLILPGLEGMDAEALEKIIRFCQEGGTVIATRRLPDRACGVDAVARFWTRAGAVSSPCSTQGYGDAGREERVSSMVRAMFGTERAGNEIIAHKCGKGRAIFVPDERESLVKVLAGLHPDVLVEPYQPEVSFVHRRAGNRDIYFLVNVGETEARFRARFHVPSGFATFWNPMNGEMEALSQENAAGGPAYLLELPPHGSAFIVFGPSPDAQRPAPRHSRESGNQRPTPYPQPSTLNLTWRVAFDGPDAPEPRETRELVSWTEWPGARFFSGQAVYTGEFRWEGDLPKRCLLRFAQVREVAAVRVNEKSAGNLWTPPWELDIAPLLRPGVNKIAVTVANLPVNRFLGLPDPDLKRLRQVYGNRFPDPEEKRLMKEPAPSGLIGAVTLLVER